MTTIFFLSPARCDGRRAEMLATSPTSPFGKQLRSDGAALGDVFTWLSALYFRGKLTYARTFATPPEKLAGSLVMASSLGLRSPDHRITTADLRAMGKVDVSSDGFAKTLRADAEAANEQYGAEARVVLLGSIATGKYVDALLDVFGARLLFPASFVGRGDMSRGGLLLRAVRSREELAYTPIAGATRHGKRPPKLPRVQASTG